MKEQIRKYLPAACPWRDTLYWNDTVESTNTLAKEMASIGAKHGTVFLAGSQTGGRGRLGRSFQSPAGMGVYLSVILRPNCRPQQLMHLTCAAAVAMCDAVENCAAIRPGIKWINDLVWGDRKLGGILTELQVDPKSGNVDYAVVGVGINCCQQPGDFPTEIRDIATSLSIVSGKAVQIPRLAACMILALEKMAKNLGNKEQMLCRYRADCITLGKDVRIVRGDESSFATALDIDSDGGLIVRLANGTVTTVSSGEVSVRGMYGYA